MPIMEIMKLNEKLMQTKSASRCAGNQNGKKGTTNSTMKMELKRFCT